MPTFEEWDKQAGFNSDEWHMRRITWQACEASMQERIKQLEAELANLQEKLDVAIQGLKIEMEHSETLVYENNRLQDKLDLAVLDAKAEVARWWQAQLKGHIQFERVASDKVADLQREREERVKRG